MGHCPRSLGLRQAVGTTTTSHLCSSRRAARSRPMSKRASVAWRISSSVIPYATAFWSEPAPYLSNRSAGSCWRNSMRSSVEVIPLGFFSSDVNVLAVSGPYH